MPGIITLRTPASRARRCPKSLTLGVCTAAMSIAACGSSGHKTSTEPRTTVEAKDGTSTSAAAASPCQSKARTAIAVFLSVRAVQVAGSTSVGNNGSPQCLWSVKLAGARVTTLVNVDKGPQPYFILERTIVEDSQEFSATALHPGPLSITRLGLEAAWFPQYPYLMVTDGYQLLTVTVRWAHRRQGVERELAEAVARTYLHTPHGKTAERLADGYPSG